MEIIIIDQMKIIIIDQMKIIMIIDQMKIMIIDQMEIIMIIDQMKIMIIDKMKIIIIDQMEMIIIYQIKIIMIIDQMKIVIIYYLQVRTLFLQWIPWVLRMARPGEKITRKTIMMQNKMKELDLKEKSSKSLLANVLDMDDDFVPSSSLPHSHVHPHHPGHGQPGQQKNGGFIRLVF